MTSKKPTSHTYFSQRLRLHYADWGNVGAPPMLLVHGVQDHCHSWDWFAEVFAGRYHVLAPDLRGHGDSEWVRGSSYHHPDYVYDLDQLVRQRQLIPSVIVSHSMGGTLASIFTGVYPECVSALVIIEGVGFWPGLGGDSEPEQRLDEWIRTTRDLASRQPRRYDSLEEAYERMQHANVHLTPDQARHLTLHGSNRNEDGSYSWKFDNYTHAWPAFRIPPDDLAALWRRIRCPVLIINGSEGFPHRIGQDGTDVHFADARIVEVAGAGHWAHHDKLDDVVGAVEGFLAGVFG
ncbi:MAG: alpha/beta hydrolase [Pseudomonadales bacterium]